MDRHPDIIIFNPDQMRADALRHLGNPASVTPNLDRFQQTDAVSFRNAFCQNPVCVPSRCSFATGLYPHVYGHRTMAHLLRSHESSIFSELKDAGYDVWMNARNDLIAGQIKGLCERHASEIFYGGEVPSAPGPVRENPRGKRGDKDFYSFYRGQLKVDENGKNYSSDDEAVDAAARYIRTADPEQPLCVFLGLMFPHPPYQVEEPYFSAIDRQKLRRRAKNLPDADKAYIEQLVRQNMIGLEQYTEADWDEMRAVYLGMCMKVDEEFGRLIQALKDAGRYDNAAIFFFSDHGDYTGDYDLPEKNQNAFPHCLTNVPLLVKPPKGVPVDAGISDSLVELVDFYATAMDFAGVTPDHTQFGRSLRPVLADRKAPFREYVFCEGGRNAGETHCDEYHNAHRGGENVNGEYWPRQKAMSVNEAHCKGTMIFDGRYKLVYRAHGKLEFYDLQTDPLEEHNVAKDGQYLPRILELQAAMLAWYQDTCDIVPYQYDARFSAEMLWNRVKRMVPPEHADEMKKLIEDGGDIAAVMSTAFQYSKK